MAHLHDIIDNDLMFAINEHTRIVSCVGMHNPVLVQFDHNSERITFEMPRYIEGHDMSLCNKVEVHYLNVSAAEKVAGVYVVDDLQISPATDSTVRFTWLVSRNATGIAGALNFVIRFACITGDVVDYAWSTAICSDISISEGLNNGEAVAEEYHDIIAGLEARLAKLEDIVLTLDAPVIEIEENKPDTPTGYYIEFSDDAAYQIDDKGASVEIDGVMTTVSGGEKYYCNTCKIAGNYSYNMSYSGKCDIQSNASWSGEGYLEDFGEAIITLNGNVTITHFEEK